MSLPYLARLEEAETLHGLGWSLVPLASGSKEPKHALLPKDHDGKATWRRLEKHPLTTRQIARCLELGGNLGVICGPASGGLVIFDFDREPPGSLLATETAIAKTPRGYHIYFTANGDARAQRFDGGDFLAAGRYAVVPPSVLSTGGSYRWLKHPDEVGLAAIMPLEFRQLLERTPSKQVSRRSLQKHESRDTRDTRLPTIKELGRDGWVELFTREEPVRAMLAVLGIPDDGMTKNFCCVLPGHTEQHPSASLFWNDEHHRIMYSDWHLRDGSRFYTLPDLRASIASGRPRHLYGPEEAVWGLRLCAEAKLLRPRKIAAARLPPDANPDIRRAYAGFQLLLSLKYSIDDPAAFALRFAAAWTGLNIERVGTAIRELKEAGFLIEVDKLGRIALYRVAWPRPGVHLLSGRECPQEAVRASTSH